MIDEINNCLNTLKSGGIILYPTDTVWGIGCDATNEEAVKKIYDIKQRDNSKNFIVLVNNDGMLNRYVYDVPEIAWDIIDLSAKPTTIVYSKGINLAKNILKEDESIAIRLCKDLFCNKLIHKFGKPIVSTSANISKTATPLTFNEISNYIINQVDYIVDQKMDKGTHQPSSLIKLASNGEVEVLRK